jgi:hypothetical protein
VPKPSSGMPFTRPMVMAVMVNGPG